MSSKTKIVVLHLKELIYTGIFAVLGILFLVLMVLMFLPEKNTEVNIDSGRAVRYVPGKYTTSLMLGDAAVDIEVVVDEDQINSISIVNLDDAVATMYPLMEPSLNELAQQIYEKQSLEDITYPDENKYTSMVLLNAISSALQKASVTSAEDSEVSSAGN